jgi:IclR family pca regulon transcriptional regulator
MTVAISVGTRFPAYPTSMGRVLLAAQSDAWVAGYLNEIELIPRTPLTVTDKRALATILRRVGTQGFALVDQELETGLRSIAVPLHGVDGAVVAAMNVSVHVSRGDPETVRRELLPPLMEAARAVTADLAAGHLGAAQA